MTFLEIFGLLLIALLISLIFFFAIGLRVPWGSFWTFFLILLLGVLVADLWLTPIGPVFWGISWVPILFFGFILALLLAAAESPLERRRRYEAKRSGDVTKLGQEHTSLAFSAFFWILLIFLVIAILIGILI